MASSSNFKSNETTSRNESLNQDHQSSNNMNNSNRNNSNQTSRSYQKSRKKNYQNDNNNQAISSLSESQSNQNKIKPSSKSPSNDNKSTARRRPKLISICSTNSNAITCVCCLHELQTYVYYSCMHSVCLNCSIKMRVICQKTDCPICRQESSQVFCTKKILKEKSNLDDLIRECKIVIRAFSSLKPIPSTALPDLNKAELTKIKNSGMYLDESIIRDEYDDALMSQCVDCDEEFKCFDDLENHVRRSHKKFYCELCLDNLKLFPFERKYYTREDLATHKRKGDKGDHGFKGHPICNYCDQRFFDKDDLYRHYRRDHYYCHFCDSDGQEEYYHDYSELREHFLKHHFLCELDTCSQNAAQTHEYVVFRNDLDLQAHKKQKHAKNKNEAKSYGKLKIEFNMTRTAGGRDFRDGRDERSDRSGNSRGRGKAFGRHSDSTQNFNTLIEDEFSSSNHRRVADNIDPNVLQMSKAQYVREEEERNRKKHLKNLKEQYQKYEQENPDLLESIDTQKTSTETTVPKVEEEVEGAAAAPTMWRSVIGQGNAPKINREAEFPSLVSETTTKSPSFGFLGQQPKNAWSSKTPAPAPVLQGTSKQALSKKQAKRERQKAQKESELAEKNKIVVESDINQISNRLNLQAISAATTSPVTSNMQDLKKYLDKTPKLSESDPREVRQKSISPDKNNLEINTENFPPPPGFGNKINVCAPPGFKSAPPGFESTIKTLDLNLEPEESNLKEYIKPEDYTKRNQVLTIKLTDLFGIYYEAEFEKFKQLSAQFQKNDLKASDYLSRCQNLLDFLPNYSKFYDLVQEMIVLLPDPVKQQQLFKAYFRIVENSEKNSEIKSNWAKNNKSFKPKEPKLSNKLLECQFCQQYFLNSEFNFHQSNHHKKEMAEYYSMSAASSNDKIEENTKIVDDFPSLLISITTQTDYSSSDKSSSKTPVQINDANDFPTLETSTKTNHSANYSSETVKNVKKNNIQTKTSEKKTVSENQSLDDFPSLLTTVQSKTNSSPKSFQQSYVFAKKSQIQYEPEKEKLQASLSSVITETDDFPALGGPSTKSEIQYSTQLQEKPKVQKKVEKKTVTEDDFPALSSGTISEQRFSTMPTASIFSNPNSHLSVLNKKKHRLQK